MVGVPKGSQPAGHVADSNQQRINEQVLGDLAGLRNRLVTIGDEADPSGGATIDAEARTAIIAILDALRGL